MEKQISKVYTGKAKGCRCGCNGDYSYSKSEIEAARSKVRNWQDAGQKVVIEQTASYIDYVNGKRAVTFYFA